MKRAPGCHCAILSCLSPRQSTADFASVASRNAHAHSTHPGKAGPENRYWVYSLRWLFSGFGLCSVSRLFENCMMIVKSYVDVQHCKTVVPTGSYSTVPRSQSLGIYCPHHSPRPCKLKLCNGLWNGLSDTTFVTECCFTKFSRALQNILSKFVYCRNRTFYANFKPKLCTCAQSHALGTFTKFQLAILTIT